MSDYFRLAGLGIEYLLYGCAILACIVIPYGVLKLAWWNLRRSRLFKRD